MTGPQHYAEAEQLLESCGDFPGEVADWKVAMAQVHATLAVAAATIEAASATAGASTQQFDPTPSPGWFMTFNRGNTHD